jgi:radical SAM superfamily enzyme YgiQ (UPF0313 family)
VLYNPRAVFYTMPLGILSVGSQLDPARFEVILVDGRLEQDPVAALREHLDEALCLGVTVLTGAPIRDALHISRAAKQIRPDLPVIWGGWHPSMFAGECLADPSVDVTVQGQGEATLGEIVERLARGDSLEGCLGCAFVANGQLHFNPPRPMKELDSFRPHDYGLIDVERYYRLKGRRQLDYISSQGCHFRCAFCADPFVYQRRWEGLSPARMGQEVETLWKRYGFTDLSFQDETFFTHESRVDAIAEEFLRRKLPITWAATMRADQGSRLSEETFAKCRSSGLRRVIIGVESGSQEMIDRIQKDIRLEQVFLAAERCRRYGVAAQFPFIVGFPGESDQNVRASLDVAKRLGAMSPKFETPIFYFRPYPGTQITTEVVHNGFALPCSLEDWATFDYVGSIGPWVSAAKYRLVERFKFYQRLACGPARLWKQPWQRLARWRLEHDWYALPLEKVVSERLFPRPRFS